MYRKLSGPHSLRRAGIPPPNRTSATAAPQPLISKQTDHYIVLSEFPVSTAGPLGPIKGRLFSARDVCEGIGIGMQKNGVENSWINPGPEGGFSGGDGRGSGENKCSCPNQSSVGRKSFISERKGVRLVRLSHTSNRWR
jgi:hypothetical protein